MLNNLIVAAIPHTEPWGFNTALVMIIANLVAISIGRFTFARRRGSHIDIAKSVVDAQIVPNLAGFDSAELIASMSFGHLLGVGLVLGLTNVGVI
ncbi:photosystem I reaction center subunit PsaK [Chamaesiphon sp.]|uniref:photosystem I reaction center subunit PsaK n=1 Tax=Chamaesiphon sp. TaxID=2814140 RepID=UPI003593DF00